MTPETGHPPRNLQALGDLPTLADCVHCGLCLPACPTYALTGRESQSPRGRIAALRALAEDRTELTPALADGLDDCLVCRACESHCPSGISMESLVPGYRHLVRGAPGAARGPQLPRRTLGRRLGSRLETLFLARIVAHPRRLARWARVARLAGPLLALARPWLPLDVPSRVRLAQVLQEIPGRAHPRRPSRGTVALLRGCLADQWFRTETLATLRVLVHNGYVVSTVGPACCGALHRHAGLLEQAQELGEHAAQALAAVKARHVVIEAAGCAPALAHPCADSKVAHGVAARVVDPFTLLARDGWEPPSRALSGEWIVAPPCHLRHGPLDASGHATVLEHALACGYREIPGADHCCGAAGTYLLRRPALSRRIGHAARDRFLATGAQGLLASNPGCLLRWEQLLAGRDSIEVLHPMVALDRAYRLAGDYRRVRSEES